MTILVTGGAGFIGSNFVLDWLQESNEIIINIDLLTYAGNLNNLSTLENDERHIFIKADIGNGKLIYELLEKYKPRAIVNFAAESHVDRSINGPQDFINTNIVGTFSLLESTRRYWDLLEKDKQGKFCFLHVSTDEVYGSLGPNDHGFTENHKYAPNSPYSASKASSDHLVRAYFHTYNLPVVTTNCSNNYGPYHFPEKLIPLCILNAINEKELPVYGDGLQIRDWLYVSDHCRAIRMVLEDGEVGGTYNIGGSNEKTNIEVVKLICKNLDEIYPRKDGESYENQIKFIKDRPGHDRRYAIDSSKIENELKWQPIESFEGGLRKTIKWYLANISWTNNIISGEYQNWVNSHYK